MFCRLLVAGSGLKFNYYRKTAGTQMKRTSGRLIPWLLHDPVYDRTARLLPPYAKPAEAMGGEYIPMILSLQWIIGIEQTSEISSEMTAGFGFFPVSTKMKARRACANIFRQLKSYIISFLYLLGNLLLFREFIVFLQLCESYAQICEFQTKLRCWEESRSLLNTTLIIMK